MYNQEPAIPIITSKKKSKPQKSMGDILNELNNMKQTMQSMKTEIKQLKKEVNELKQAETKRVNSTKESPSKVAIPKPKVLTLQEEIDMEAAGEIRVSYSNLHQDINLEYFSKYVKFLLPRSEIKCQVINNNGSSKCFNVQTSYKHLAILTDRKNWQTGTIITSLNIKTSPSPTLKLGLFKPSNWTKMGKNENLKLVVLKKSSREFEHVLNLIDDGIIGGVTKICRIQNVLSYCRFLLRQEEFQSRGNKFEIMELFHDTSAEHVTSIAQYNFDWRRHTKRSRFGKGVYFGTKSEYCNRYSSPDVEHRALFVVDVIMGNIAKGKARQLIPPETCDATVGNNGSAYAKYYDDEFYPKYVVYYTDLQYIYDRL